MPGAARRVLLGAVAALALGLARPSAGAIGDGPGEQPPLPPGARLDVRLEDDNDVMGLARRTTDDLYTQGARLSVRWAAGGPDSGREVGIVVGQEIYTPTGGDLETTDLARLRRDRPYAGWLYAAVLLRFDGDAPHSLRLGADAGAPGERTTEIVTAAGVTGRPSGAEELQNGFHSLVRRWSGNPRTPPDALGWSVYQTATRGTLDVSLRTRFDLVQVAAPIGDLTARTGSLLAARLSPRARLDVGTTFDAASLGLELRGGLLTPPWGRSRPSLPFELWAYARADGRYVLYNAFIEGPLLHGVAPLVGIEPWVAELTVGVVLRLGRAELGFGQLWRTREFTPSPPGARGMHQIGQVTAGWTTP